MYGSSRSVRDRRERAYDEDDVVMSAASDTDYYRSRSHRDTLHPSSTHPHIREGGSPRAERHYLDEERPRTHRPRSPYPTDDRWTPREKLVPSSHATYAASAYEEGYSRRNSDDPYRQVAGYPEDAWTSHHPVKDRETYASSGYHSWDRAPAYSQPVERDERPRHHHTQHHATHSRHTYDWSEDERMKPQADRVPDDREWTRRGDDRAWTRDDGHYVRDDLRASGGARGWEPRAAYPPEPAASTKSSEPKFAPGPGWKGDDQPSSNRGNHRELWREKGKYDGKKKNKNRGENGASKDHEHRGRDNGYQNKKSGKNNSSKADRKAHKRRRSVSRSPSRSRSRSGSPASPIAPSVSSTKRRRKGSSSPDRLVDRSWKKGKAGRKGRSPSPKARGRDVNRTPSRYSRSRSGTPSTSPGPSKTKGKKPDLSPFAKRKARSRSFSRSRSPSSSPQASLKSTGANGAVKHRLPPSGPRPADFMHVKIQPVASTFNATATGRKAVEAAYQRRNQIVGEPPPVSRANFVPGPGYTATKSAAPAPSKGTYPPPTAIVQPQIPKPTELAKPSGKPRMVPAVFRPIAPAAPATTNAAVKQFFPGDDEDPESTPVPEDPEARGGGKGFGIIPARSKHPAGRQRSPAQSTRGPRAASPSQHSRPSTANSPMAPVSHRTTQDTLVQQRTSSPRSDERIANPPVTETAQAPAPTEVYQLVNQVGEGTFGKVYKARNVLTGALVALKRIKVEAEKEGFPVTALREIKLLQSLSNANVVSLHEMMVSKGNIYMVFEYLEHDLTGVLSQTQFAFSEAHLKSLCHQMLTGLAYLHHKGVVHRDMKGSNILVNSRGELKLADFGLARVFQKRRRSDYTNRVITLWYRPPELLLGTTVYGPEVDMWSAGTIMLELFTKRPVFQGNDEIHQLEVIYHILGTPTTEQWPGLTDMPWYELVKPSETRPNHFRTMFAKFLSPAALDLAEGLLTYDPEKRFTATTALDAPYFTKEDPPMELPVGLSSVEGEWHELETKREKEKLRKRKKTEAANGHDNISSGAASASAAKPAQA